MNNFLTIAFKSKVLLTIEYPSVHKKILNAVTNALAYISPSLPNRACIRGNPIYAALENIQPNLTIGTLSPFNLKDNKNVMANPTTKSSMLNPNAYNIFLKILSSNSVR